jgi:hypothetical protein
MPDEPLDMTFIPAAVRLDYPAPATQVAVTLTSEAGRSIRLFLTPEACVALGQQLSIAGETLQERADAAEREPTT